VNASVLAIGLDPRFADLSAFPGLTPELVRSYIDTQIEKLRQAGYRVESCLVDGSATSDEVVARALQSQPFACVLIGAGLRLPPQQLRLFERVINRIHVLAPAAKICFNSSVADTLESVQRWIGPDSPSA